jgi:hypothetical protein
MLAARTKERGELVLRGPIRGKPKKKEQKKEREKGRKTEALRGLGELSMDSKGMKSFEHQILRRTSMHS